MGILKPKKLEKGDLIGIISPASSPDDLTRIESGVKYLEKLGYRTVVGKNVGKSRGYLAGTDEERIDDIHAMFKDKNVKAIICVRGGYGTPRLLDRIDYKLIKKNPKIFVGYSDITALQMAIFKKTGLVTFAGPMLAVDLYKDPNPFAEELFWRMLTSSKKLGALEQPDGLKLNNLTKGTAKGMLLGGNLALLVSILGTEYFPSVKDSILVLEDIGETPYRVDRLLNQLKLSKVLSGTQGVLLGAFTDCNEEDPNKKTLSLGEVVTDYLGALDKPVLYNFSHGHIKEIITVPWGIQAKINAGKCRIDYLEGAVS